MRAWITGVTGFAGSHLAEHLLDCGDRVLGTSRTGCWSQDAPQALCRDVGLVSWDITQPPESDVLNAVKQFSPDCVFHLAAISVPSDCGETSPNDLAWAVNVEGTRRVLQLAGGLGGSPRVLVASSSQVYRPVGRRCQVVDEQWPIGPVRGYGKSKLEAERVAADLAAEHGLHVIVARAFQHTGPRQEPRLMLPQWAHQFARGDETVSIYTRHSFLDLSDVRDTVRAYRAMVSGEGRWRTYNVGSGSCRQSGEVLQLLQSHFDSPRRVQETEPEHRYHAIADIERLKQDTGWCPRIPLDRTVADTLAYWKQRLRS